MVKKIAFDFEDCFCRNVQFKLFELKHFLRVNTKLLLNLKGIFMRKEPFKVKTCFVWPFGRFDIRGSQTS